MVILRSLSLAMGLLTLDFSMLSSKWMNIKFWCLWGLILRQILTFAGVLILHQQMRYIHVNVKFQWVWIKRNSIPTVRNFWCTLLNLLFRVLNPVAVLQMETVSYKYICLSTRKSKSMYRAFQWVLRATQKSCLNRLSIVIGYAQKVFTRNRQ